MPKNWASEASADRDDRAAAAIDLVAANPSGGYTDCKFHHSIEGEPSVAKKRTAKKTAKTTKKAGKKVQYEEIILDPLQDEAVRLVDKSAKVRAELEAAVTLMAAKVVRKVMKEHGIALTPPQAAVLTTILFVE
jgi:hypothetical protein